MSSIDIRRLVLVAVDPEAAAEKLRALVSVARRTLADARQMV